MQYETPHLQFVRRIAIDDRERGSGVIEALRDHPDVELTVRRLELGDYLIDRTLVVERKTLSDFALSVVDGRLFTQASRLARTSRARPCFILEGAEEDHTNPVISRS
ncbi:MAG TPA: ERCC4 domain-containing protein, partial [Candidatus Sulfomarinibacteraceae bacterium]|nr:ERCC4 domain-containing protein [Candidatus Sulfomarinibacteraceae bacterium]